MYDHKVVELSTDIPDPQARDYVVRDKESVSPSGTRAYPLMRTRWMQA
jgi:hypothetical protein